MSTNNDVVDKIVHVNRQIEMMETEIARVQTAGSNERAAELRLEVEGLRSHVQMAEAALFGNQTVADIADASAVSDFYSGGSNGNDDSHDVGTRMADVAFVNVRNYISKMAAVPNDQCACCFKRATQESGLRRCGSHIWPNAMWRHAFRTNEIYDHVKQTMRKTDAQTASRFFFCKKRSNAAGVEECEQIVADLENYVTLFCCNGEEVPANRLYSGILSILYREYLERAEVWKYRQDLSSSQAIIDMLTTDAYNARSVFFEDNSCENIFIAVDRTNIGAVLHSQRALIETESDTPLAGALVGLYAFGGIRFLVCNLEGFLECEAPHARLLKPNTELWVANTLQSDDMCGSFLRSFTAQTVSELEHAAALLPVPEVPDNISVFIATHPVVHLAVDWTFDPVRKKIVPPQGDARIEIFGVGAGARFSILLWENDRAPLHSRLFCLVEFGNLVFMLSVLSREGAFDPKFCNKAHLNAIGPDCADGCDSCSFLLHNMSNLLNTQVRTVSGSAAEIAAITIGDYLRAHWQSIIAGLQVS